MFGIFKNKLEASEVAATVARASSSYIDVFFHEFGIEIPRSEQATIEFSYILGWYAVQSSDFDNNAKHRLSVALIKATLEHFDLREDMQTLKMIQNAIVVYRDAAATRPNDVPLDMYFSIFLHMSGDPFDLENPSSENAKYLVPALAYLSNMMDTQLRGLNQLAQSSKIVN